MQGWLICNSSANREKPSARATVANSRKKRRRWLSFTGISTTVNACGGEIRS